MIAGLRKIIFQNFWLKFISLSLATIIWFTIHYGIQNDFKLGQPHNNHLSQELMQLPINFMMQPSDGRVFKLSRNEVTVTVVGEDVVLRKLSGRDIEIYIDLKNFHSRGASAEELHAYAPNGVTVLKINPSVVNVEQISP